ncbi:MAG: DUF4382 domain-containing protein [Saprospiraceae bacterium]
MTLSKLNVALCFLGLFGLFSSCTKEDDSNLKGAVQFEITDAPIDDARVKSAVVTISEVRIDGTKVDGFNKTTVDLLAYQNGNTKLLFDSEMEAKSYNNVTLVLDFETDANGNAPGCYVEEQGNGVKHKLESSTNEITLNQAFTVTSSGARSVIDFDLRKCIREELNGSDDFDFVSETELKSGIRIVNKNQAGVIMGKCTDTFSSSDKLIVYAYKKGEYNRNTEIQGQGESQLEFANAVSSAAVDANGNYSLHFLEPGDYELHFCSYEENNEGKMELKGTLLLDVLTAIDLGAINVDASASVTVDVLVTGLLPL